MFVYRITDKKFSTDLNGTGAKLYGGRWNSPGRNVVYTSASVSLAALEVLVHTTVQAAPKNLVLVILRIPDSRSLTTLQQKSLPDGWNNVIASKELQKTGDSWLQKNKTLILKVPSAIIPSEWNYLLNPLHKFFSKVKIARVEDFSFDKRILPGR